MKTFEEFLEEETSWAQDQQHDGHQASIEFGADQVSTGREEIGKRVVVSAT